MRRTLTTLAILTVALLAGRAIAASDLSRSGLMGLEAVRVQVISSDGLDPVDVEVSVLRQLAARGIFGDPSAEALLAVDTHRGDAFAGAGVSLVQEVVLERDPLLAARVSTWSMGETSRLGAGADSASASLDLLERVVDRFLQAWSEANP